MNRQPLDDQWMLLEAPLAWQAEQAAQVLRQEAGWYRNLHLPCDVHQPLIASGVIRDPVLADYSFDAAWIEQRSWWFRRSITPRAGWRDCQTVELVIESLDAQADVFLNGSIIGHQASAFFPFRRDVRHLLFDGANDLLIRLTCGLETVRDADLAEIDFAVSTEAGNGCPERGDKRRAFIRKPAYVFGWDWCPRIATCGIVKSAWLEYHGATAIRGVRVETLALPGSDKRAADLRVVVEVEQLDLLASADADLVVEISRLGKIVATQTQSDLLLCSGWNYLESAICVDDAELWWPNGMGDPALYELSVSLTCRGQRSTWPVVLFGIRVVALDIGREDANNRRFQIRVNGVPVFCQGGNWIPADSIYARVSDARYDQLVAQAQKAHFNMLRVWGGGLYERDAFYAACDRYGILVWQDMMFACAAYPDHRASFRDLVGQELDYQTARLRNHACLALFCGNNENHWIYGNAGKRGAFRMEQEKQYGLLSANRQMPELVRKNCPQIPYWNSSPYGGAEPNAPQVGDVHHWHAGMMNPDMAVRIEPRRYDQIEARFVSEYGYPGPCVRETVVQYLDSQAPDRTSRVWQLHTNTFEKKTVAAGVSKHYTDKPLELDDYLLYAGMTQSLMLGYSLESLRAKTACSGALFWMYNDCWGEVGWTIVDYYLRRKIAYYGVRRALAPRRLILRRQDDTVRVIACNDTALAISLTLQTGWTGFDGAGLEMREHAVTLPAHSRGEILRFPLCGDLSRGVHFARPLPDETVRYGLEPGLLLWGEYRHLALCPPVVAISSARDDGLDQVIIVEAATFAHGVHIILPPEIEPSDAYFDLLPGERRTIRLPGAAGQPVDLRTVAVDLIENG